MSTRWEYENTNDLYCVHAYGTNNTTTDRTDPHQIEYRFQNSAGTEYRWHRPAEAGTSLVGKAVFPVDIPNQDRSKMSQIKFYLTYSGEEAERDSVTHIVCDMISSREIKGLELICGFLIQADENPNGSAGYGNNQTLQWDVYKEPITIAEGGQTFIRQLPPEHIKKQAAAQVLQPRQIPFYYWRMEGLDTFRPGDEIEFSFRFVCQPFAKAKVGVHATSGS